MVIIYLYLKEGNIINILHYSLGFPPVKTGGLTQYFNDLVIEQSKNNNVSVLFPSMNLYSKNNKIHKRIKKGNIDVYELLTPLRIPLTFGIDDAGKYLKYINNEEILGLENMLLEKKINIVHIHTFMGLTKGFFTVLNKLKIKTIYTSHDYFGICSKATLLDSESKICEDYNEGKKCVLCNAGSLSDKKLYLNQFEKLIFLKKSKIKDLIKKKTQMKKDRNKKLEQINLYEDSNLFLKIRMVYLNFFKEIDLIHFNSEVSKEVFSSYIKVKNSVVIPISNKKIDHIYRELVLRKKDNNLCFNTEKKMINLTFLGPYEDYKGLPLLLDSLSYIMENYELKNDWVLNVFGDTKKIFIKKNIQKNTIINKKYNTEQLINILEFTDLLIIPSKWKETFGFTALEAFSFGVPVMFSENVGSKMLIDNKKFIFQDKQDFILKLSSILNNSNEIIKYKNEILLNKDKYVINFSKHSEDIISIYKRMIK